MVLLCQTDLPPTDSSMGLGRSILAIPPDWMLAALTLGSKVGGATGDRISTLDWDQDVDQDDIWDAAQEGIHVNDSV